MRVRRSSGPIFATMILLACSGGSGTASTSPLATGGLGRVADVVEVACPETRASAPLPADATITACRVDADCVEGRNGRCLRLSNHGPMGPSLEATTCSYDACFHDVDCGTGGAACYCGTGRDTEPGLGHRCTAGACSVDGDCGAGRYCRRGPNGRACHALTDTCVEETDCGPGLACLQNTDGAWSCGAQSTPFG